MRPIDVPETIATFAVLLIAVAFHESAHAYVATWCGDKTAKRLGRVTLNPIPHLHPVGSLLLPALFLFSGSSMLFGAGRPVPVDRSQLRHPARDFMFVALAGPLSNLLLMVLVTGLFVALKRFEVFDFDRLVYHTFARAIELNLVLAIFNSVPIPPLDGSRFVAFLLPKSWQETFYRLDGIGIIIVVVLVVFTDFGAWLSNAVIRPLMDAWTDLYIGWMI
jgi:Zn-dependent protease